jgi:hypothetical protein
VRKLIVDPSAEARREAASRFRSLAGGQLGELRELLEALAESPAIAASPRDAIDALLKIAATLAGRHSFGVQQGDRPGGCGSGEHQADRSVSDGAVRPKSRSNRA